MKDKIICKYCGYRVDKYCEEFQRYIPVVLIDVDRPYYCDLTYPEFDYNRIDDASNSSS